MDQLVLDEQPLNLRVHYGSSQVIDGERFFRCHPNVLYLNELFFTSNFLFRVSISSISLYLSRSLSTHSDFQTPYVGYGDTHRVSESQNG